MKLSLTAKVILLVGISLAVEVGFVGTVAYLQAEAEKDARRALKAQRISNSCNRLSGDLYELWNIIGTRGENLKEVWFSDDGLPRVSGLERAVNKCMAKIKADYKRLDRLTADQPKLNTSVRQSQRNLDEAQSTIGRAVKGLVEGDIQGVVLLKMKEMPHLRKMFKGAISEDLQLAATHELAVSELSQEKQLEIRKQLLNVLLIGLFFNVIISLLMAAFLVQKITARLQIMSENTKLLTEGKPLHAPFEGDDEIASLDASFHKMRQKLAHTEQQRQEIINMITHDMRSPLMVIQNSLDLLNSAENAERVQEKLTRLAPMASKNCDRVVALLNDLLDIEKINSGMMTVEASKFFVNEIFEEIDENLKEWLVEQNVKLDVKDGDAYVLADKQLVGRLIFNLVSNAVRFAPAGTAITLQAVENRDSTVEISVADQGKGIPKEELNTIFERFRQVKDTATSKSERTGSGLGLTICRSIAELHGGAIWVESEVGQGTVFHFTLPAAVSV